MSAIEAPIVELRVTIDGDEVFALLHGDVLTCCAECDVNLVLSALAEALVMLCGTRPRPDFVVSVAHLAG